MPIATAARPAPNSSDITLSYHILLIGLLK
jgi:hypothetical protein